MAARGAGRSFELPDLPNTGRTETVQIQIGEELSSLSALELHNRNTFRDVEISNIRVFDPTVRGDYEPTNPLSTAQDARIELDGVPVTRSSNEIDDLIPGVTLQLNRASPRTETLEISPDRELVKNSIIEFVGFYNQLLTEVNILTRNDPSVVDQIGYFTDEEREAALERLGMFQGDSTLTLMRSRLQTLMMNPYPTEAGREMNLLAQMGISTNAGGFGGGVNVDRLRGYLEVNEDQLDTAIQNYYASVKDLFGNDTDGDLVVDSGVAYQVERTVTPYAQSGGIIATRRQSLDNQISNTEDDISSYQERLDRYEQELREDFGQMESAMEELQRSQRALQNLPSSGGNNQ
jgi:flagellar hook-associated protein 2